MSLQEKLLQDLQQAMRVQDTARRDTLRLLRSGLSSAEIKVGRALSEIEEIEIITREAKRRREAIDEYTSLDRQGLIDAIYRGDAVWGYPIPWELGDHPEWPPKPKEWLPESWFNNPQKAKQLLADAGYPNGLKAKMIFIPNPGPTRTQNADVATYVADNLRAIGINVELVSTEIAAFNSQLYSGSWDDLIFSISSTAGGYEWDDWVYWAFHSRSSKNPTWDHLKELKDTKLDDLLDRARETSVEAERKKLRREIFDYLAGQHYRVQIIGAPWYSIVHKYLQNWASNSYAWAPYMGGDQVRTTWLEDDAPGRKQSY